MAARMWPCAIAAGHLSQSPGSVKLDALRQTGTLHPHPKRVTDSLFQSQPFFDVRDLMQVKYEMLRKVEADGAPVSTAATTFGLSRPSFYQAQAAFEQGGLAGLAPQKRGPPEQIVVIDTDLGQS